MQRRIGVLLGGLFLILGCQDGLAPNEGLHSTVALDRTRLGPGDSVQITLRVTASGGKGTLSGSSSCLTGYSVLDASGTVVAPGGVICTADLVRRSILSGGLVRRFTWHGYSSLWTQGHRLPPGIYRIVGGPGTSGHINEGASEPVSLELLAEPEAEGP